MKKRALLRDAAFGLIVLAFLAAMIYCGYRLVATVLFPAEQESGSHKSKIITREDVDYFPRQDITTILVMGIDRIGPVEASIGYNNPGASDMNILLIFDETNRQCNAIHLNRDTMVEMPVLGIGGKQAGTLFGQLALAHTYGTGLDDSCINTCNTVSAFLYGTEIDYYLAMNMDAIAILNDAVGGVTVNVTDDFSLVDPTIGMGQVTLTGTQALEYVRTRKDVGDQQNPSRIRRHQEYLDGFVEAFRSAQAEDTSFILTAYEQVQPYIVTDCSANAVSGMVEQYGDFTINEVVSPEGENRRGEEYYEFYADEEKLDELILRLLYAPVR